MKVLFVNFRNNSSSAILRIFDTLSISGIDVRILSYKSLVNKRKIYVVKGIGKLIFSCLFLYDILVTRYFYKKTGRLFSRNSNIFSKFISDIYLDFFSKYDLVNIHWVGHGFMPVNFLKRLEHSKIIITLHDYYFITGGCHIPGECIQYKSICNNCPSIFMFFNFPKENYYQKQELYSLKKIYAIVPSQIMANKVLESSLGKLFLKVTVIPNPIDTEIYMPLLCPLRQKENLLFNNIPENKKYILFVANDLSDHNKGFDLLVKIINGIHDLDSICLITVGNNYDKITNQINFNYHHFGEIKLNTDMVKIYNLAYITLVTSRFESFSQVTLESMACGCPVIAFDSSGPSEIIKNNIDGFLVESFSIPQFVNRVNEILSNTELRSYFAKKGRQKVKNNFSYAATGSLMKDFFESVNND